VRMHKSAGWFGFGRARDCRLAVHVLGVLGLLILGLSLVSAPVADASPTSFTWTGQSTITENWSAAANWEGGAAPTTGEGIETLTFPRLTSSACINEPASHPCYVSFNDVSGLSAKSMQIDDANEYLIGGDQITIGSGGLSASPATGASSSAGDIVEVPLHLSAPQTWHIAGRSGGLLGENGLLLAGSLTGSGDALTIELGNGPLLFLAKNDTEVGPLTINGADTSKVAANGIVSILGGKLDSSDGEPVSISHVFFAGSGAIGPLTTSTADLDVGSPTAGMEVTSATFDSASYVEFNVTGAGAAAQTDYSQLVSHGSIELANSKIEVVVRPPKKGEPCPTLTAGRTYTFVSTSGSLSGAFANAPEGGPEIPIRFAKSCAQISQKLRIAYHESGGTQTVTGTVEAGVAEKQEQEAKEHEEGIKKLAEEHAKKIAEETAAAAAAAKKKGEEEVAAAAAIKRQEEVAAGAAAAKRRLEEEAAATKNEAEAQATVSLDGSTLTVQGGGKAAVRLVCTGTGTCDGKLTLTRKSTSKKGKKAKTETIGTATFSIPAGKTMTVELKLNGTGRSLLVAAHGRLGVTLTILKSFPAPSQTRTEHVQLVQQKVSRKAKK
jgi:hypothetical protein